jgi:hypothetical protein
MAYQTFIPNVWNEELNRALDEKLTFVKNCNRQYEGSLKEVGNSVKILNVGKPTITSYTLDTDKDTIHTNIGSPEKIDNSSVTMYITKAETYNYYVGDIDKVQMMNDGAVKRAYQEETAQGLAEKMDTYVGQTIFALAPTFTNSFSNATYNYIKAVASASDTTPIADDPQNALEILDDVIEHARTLNIPDATPLFVECSPKFEKLVRQALVNIRTDNTKIIEGKEYLQYYNLNIEWSNNVKTVAAVENANAYYEYVTVRTGKAVAFVKQITEAEAYRPEAGFADAIKGLIVYDAKIVRPDQIFNVLVTY